MQKNRQDRDRSRRAFATKDGKDSNDEKDQKDGASRHPGATFYFAESARPFRSIRSIGSLVAKKARGGEDIGYFRIRWRGAEVDALPEEPPSGEAFARLPHSYAVDRVSHFP